MNEFNSLSPILGNLGTVVLVFVLWKAGFFEKKNGNGHTTNSYTQTQMDKATEDAEWKGEVKQSLKEINEKVDRFSQRLDKHLQDEEDKLDEVRQEISNLRSSS